MKISELFEAEETHVTFCFGRLNPPTRGHEHLFNVMKSVGGDYLIFPSRPTPKTKKTRLANPLTVDQKIYFLKAMFPNYASNIVDDQRLNTFLSVCQYIYDQGYTHVTIVAGSDKLDELVSLCNQFNGVEGKAHGYYKFETIDGKSSGARDPDSEGVSGISATKARDAAISGDLEKFKEVTGAGEQADELYAAVRNGLGVKNTNESSYKKIKKQRLRELFEPTIDYVKLNDGSYVQIQYRPLPNTEPVPGSVQISKADPKIIPDPNTVRLIGSAKLWQQQAIAKAVAAGQLKEIGGDWQMKSDGLTTEKQILTRIRQIMYDRKLSGTESNAGELLRLKQQLKDLRSQQGVAEGVDIGQEWMSDTELDQYVPDDLQQEWRELVGYDEAGNAHPLWANITGDYEPDASDPEHRAWMVKVANKWFAMKRIPNVRFFAVRDRDDELEWLVQIGEQDVREGWREKLAAAGMAGMMGLSGAAGAADRVPDTAKEPIIATIVIDGEARRLDLTPKGFDDVEEAERFLKKFLKDRGIKDWQAKIERSKPGTGKYQRLTISGMGGLESVSNENIRKVKRMI